MKPLIHHSVYICHNIPENRLKDEGLFKRFIYNCAKYANASPVKYSDVFHEGSLSCMLIVAESHIVAHTWPHYGYFELDSCLCGDKIKMSGIEKAIQEHFPEASYKELKIKK